MAKVNDIYEFINSIAPFDTQESWDNSGFLIGEKEKEITKVLVCLDFSTKAVKKAKELGCELIVSHHPVIFASLKTLTENNLAFLCAKNDIAVISAHTNYDIASDGVSDTLAKALSLRNIRKSESGEYTLGDIGETTVKGFALQTKQALNTHIQYCNGDKKVKTVAVCGGAGTDFMFDAFRNGADVYVTGEAKHHEFLDVLDSGNALITAGHFETEVIAMKPLKEKLEKEFKEVEFVLMNETSPIEHI